MSSWLLVVVMVVDVNQVLVGVTGVVREVLLLMIVLLLVEVLLLLLLLAPQLY